MIVLYSRKTWVYKNRRAGTLAYQIEVNEVTGLCCTVEKLSGGYKKSGLHRPL